MKFTLFAISTIALCLLQQTHAKTSPLGERELPGELTGDLTGAVIPDVIPGVIPGVITGDITGTADGAAVDSVAKRKRSKLQDAVKRETPLDIGTTLNNLLDKVKGLLEKLTVSNGLLNTDGLLGLGLDKLVDNLVKEVGTLVDSLTGEEGPVNGLLETVTNLLQTVLELLKSLGLDNILKLADLDNLVTELLGLTGGATEGGNLGPLEIVNNLIEQLGELELLGNNDLVGIDILKPVLESLDELLGGLLDGLLGGATKARLARRALIKRAIERRAAL
ncbi:unnamed protein product [Cunninghamella echinulata]